MRDALDPACARKRLARGNRLSHVACHAVHPHFRNVRDDQITRCAAKGGVIGITGAAFYLGGASAEQYFRHLDHVVQLTGPRHVGIALD